MHSEDEKVARLADTVLSKVSSLPQADEGKTKSGIKIKDNSGSINFGTQVNIGATVDARELLPAQRKELHELRAKCEELGDDPRSVWKEVHTQLSVMTLGEVTAAQFLQAKGIIQARLERLQEEADKNRLISKILRTTDEKDARQELNNFCDLNFGRTHLNMLKRSELPKVLEFIQQFEVRPVSRPAAETAPASAQAAAEPLPLREFLITYRWNCAGLFLFGLLVGGLWI